jgi:hypothetical protein
MPELEVFIISWKGQTERALAIAEQIKAAVSRVSIVHSEPAELLAGTEAVLIGVPEDHYFGRKFSAALSTRQYELAMFITADADHPDWRMVARRCREAFAKGPELGVWSPKVWFSTWSLAKVWIASLAVRPLQAVVMTDSIVWTINSKIAERLSRIDFSRNNYGYAIDSLAAMAAHTSGQVVAMDPGVEIAHPKGSGYSPDEALDQAKEFIQQFSLAEKLVWEALREYMTQRRGQKHFPDPRLISTTPYALDHELVRPPVTPAVIGEGQEGGADRTDGEAPPDR